MFVLADLFQDRREIVPVFTGYTRHRCIKDADGNESELMPRGFAEIIRESGLYHGGDIRLISCETGKDGSLTAQLFANEMGVRVMAPSDTVFVHPDGSMFVRY